MDEQKQTAIVLCIADASRNPRPNRIIKLLVQNGFNVDYCGFEPRLQLPINKKFVLKKKRSLIGRIINFFRRFFASTLVRLNMFGFAEQIYETTNISKSDQKKMQAIEYDLIFVEDLQLLPLVYRLWGKSECSKIVFDAREFYPKQNEENIRFRWFEKPMRVALCRTYLQSCDLILTVSPGLQRAYLETFNVKSKLLRSTPNYIELPIQHTVNNQIRMVHHGVANRNRSIENMIEIVKKLDDRFTLDLYLVGSNSYIDTLKKKSIDCNRIRFCKPVAFEQIISMLTEYDIGFYYLFPTGFNVTYNLPNKFFEFIQARLAIAIGPSPDMAHLVKQYQCGFVSSKFTIESMIQTLDSLVREDIDKAKINSDRAAKELCFEKEGKYLLKLIEELQ